MAVQPQRLPVICLASCSCEHWAGDASLGASSRSRPTWPKAIRPVTPYAAGPRATPPCSGRPGRAYVYPIHSRHCFNIVTEADGVGTAVLIRAVEPIEGIELMKEHRHRDKRLELARGPGCLCQAFGIDRYFDHWNLTKGRQLWLDDDGTQLDEKDAGTSTRIGVTSAKELQLRFFLRDCPYVI